jgi:hypothetical protein
VKHRRASGEHPLGLHHFRGRDQTPSSGSCASAVHG